MSQPNHTSHNRNQINLEDKFLDVAWMMPLIDLESIMDEIKPLTSYSDLPSLIADKVGEEWNGYCPDHNLCCGRVSSHPNWWLNLDTGKTVCFTEPRGSNLLLTVARLLKGSTGITNEDCEKAERFLLKKDYPESEILLLRSKAAQAKLLNKKDDTPKIYQYVEDVKRDIQNRIVTSRLENFFMYPPKKPPTNIRRETIDHYNVYEKKGGRYSGRAIIPILFKGEYRGFSAVDLLGIEEWIKVHPTLDPKEYKKTIFPSKDSGFYSKQWLFGFDDCVKKCDYLIGCEGPREVMKLWQEGFTNCVAFFGTSISDEQMLLLTELSPKRIILLFDGDKAGRQSADKAKKYLEMFFNVQIASLPQGVDPKQLGREEIKKWIGVEK
jgi:5S rRNA maturation endonuclease (ribonuclease M5)